MVPPEEGEDHGEEDMPRALLEDEVLDVATTIIDPTLAKTTGPSANSMAVKGTLW
jgi:hypothetical protein